MFRRFRGSAWPILAFLATTSASGDVVKEAYPNAEFDWQIWSPFANDGNGKLLTGTSSGKYRAQVDYNVNAANGVQGWFVKLDPPHPLYLAKPDADWSTAFTGKMGEKWTLQNATQALSDNSIVVKTYEAFEGDEDNQTVVGLNILAQYMPGANDPKAADVHWVQVAMVKTPNNSGFLLDNEGSPNNRSPYYDDGGAANGTFFNDEPRSAYDVARRVEFFLFLTTGPAFTLDGKPAPANLTKDQFNQLAIVAGQVTILGGFEYGYVNGCSTNCGEDNQALPEPRTGWLIVGGLLVMLIRMRKVVLI